MDIIKNRLLLFLVLSMFCLLALACQSEFESHLQAETSAPDGVPQKVKPLNAEYDDQEILVHQTSAEYDGLVDRTQSSHTLAQLRQSFSESILTGSDSSRISTAPNSPQIEFLSYSNYVDEIQFHHIIGEVKNQSPHPVGFVKVVATFYDEAGRVIETEDSFTALELIPPAGKSPFEITFQKNPRVMRYDLHIEAKVTRDVPHYNLRMVNTGDQIDNLGNWHITGEVANNGITPAKSIQVIATVYDEGGKAVAVGRTFNLETIRGGGKSSFEITLPKQDNFAKFELQIQGDWTNSLAARW